MVDDGVMIIVRVGLGVNDANGVEDTVSEGIGGKVKDWVGENVKEGATDAVGTGPLVWQETRKTNPNNPKRHNRCIIVGYPIFASFMDEW
jgi:hypothetical protein